MTTLADLIAAHNRDLAARGDWDGIADIGRQLISMGTGMVAAGASHPSAIDALQRAQNDIAADWLAHLPQGTRQ